jgi:alpha-tubulin suppressor-like RCC1 family protein
VVGIAAGYTHSAAVRQDGTVWTWGGNAYGQLGLGSTKNQKRPMQVSTLANIGAVGVGGYHTLALRGDGQMLWAFGRNQFGQLGDGTTTNRLSPVPVSVSGLEDIDGGDAFSLARASDGTVWGWGAGGSGQLDRGATTDSATPIVIATSLGPVEAVAAGGSHALVRRLAPEPPLVALTQP